MTLGEGRLSVGSRMVCHPESDTYRTPAQVGTSPNAKGHPLSGWPSWRLWGTQPTTRRTPVIGIEFRPATLTPLRGLAAWTIFPPPMYSATWLTGL